jgi:hypothetical protein
MRARVGIRWSVAVAAAAVAAGATGVACAPPPVTGAGPGPGPTTAPGPPPSPPTTTTTTGGSVEPGDPRDILAPLAIEDRPPPPGYRRDLFPAWLDTDGDGCDARQQALRAASHPPAEVTAACRVLSGTWTSDYDGLTLTSPEEVDVDHVVPLADAWRSGASTWTTDRRAALANDQANLWPVSASANRSKGDGSPDRWRPLRREVWCTYAHRWVDVKIAYRLTATTPERDALGQMLDTCRPTGAPGASASGSPASTTSGPDVSYASCAAARAAGAAPLHRGEPGYRSSLDGDGDGVACE